MSEARTCELMYIELHGLGLRGQDQGIDCDSLSASTPTLCPLTAIGDNMRNKSEFHVSNPGPHPCTIKCSIDDALVQVRCFVESVSHPPKLHNFFVWQDVLFIWPYKNLQSRSKTYLPLS